MIVFEKGQAGSAPRGWNTVAPETIAVDPEVVHDEEISVRIERKSGPADGISALEKTVEADFSGKTLELKAWVRTQNLEESPGLYLRQNDRTRMLSFSRMGSGTHAVAGTNEWSEYSVSAPVHDEVETVSFGFGVRGRGTAWITGMQLLVDGKPIAAAPQRPEEPQPASGIRIESLTPVQISNLATLCKVWGFLKYHHPLVTAGKRDWDKDLFQVLPSVLSAANAAEGNAQILRWIEELGKVEPCTDCVRISVLKRQLAPDEWWVREEQVLGKDLSQALQSIWTNRSARQYYVSQAPGVGNPVFEHERAYAKIQLPDSGYQLLSLYRFWNIFEYWAPDRNLTERNWHEVLTDYIPKIALAKDSKTYQLQMMALIAEVKDTHANLWSSLAVRPPTGSCDLPVQIRFIEGVPVITGWRTKDSPPESNLKPGDVIAALDGASVASLTREWEPLYAASNEPTRLRDIARMMGRGTCGPATLSLERGTERLEAKLERMPSAQLNLPGMTHDLPGDTFQLLPGNVAYLKLSSVKSADVPKYLESARNTTGFIVDIRNYPSEFVVFALGNHLVEKPTEFVRFTTGVLATPGSFDWTDPIKLTPEAPRYTGKVVFLIDEVTQSSAEYTTMAFRCAPGAVVIGSTTAGADGNVSPILLPGGFRSLISGIGVFYPDKRPTQRVGIIPDIEVRPTIAGIRAGKDEVLEEALRQIRMAADKIVR